MNLYWQWNHNPIDEAWSLSERPGFLRLKTARVVNNLQIAPNTLTQRMSGPECTGSVKIDLSGMKDGDVCGLAAFNSDSGLLRVIKKGVNTSFSSLKRNPCSNSLTTLTMLMWR